MRAAIIALCLLAAPAHAAVVGIAITSDGQIELHDTAGPCVGQALFATYRPANPAHAVVGGCWSAGNGMVAVMFFDGDYARFPMAAVRKPVAV